MTCEEFWAVLDDETCEDSDPRLVEVDAHPASCAGCTERMADEQRRIRASIEMYLPLLFAANAIVEADQRIPRVGPIVIGES